MPDRAWKKRERQTARWFGARRTIGSGCGGPATSASDSTHKSLFIETKLRRKHSAVTLWDKTKALAGQEGKIPVVALAEHRRPGFWLMIHADDFEAVLWERLKTLHGDAAAERARELLRRM